MKKEVSGITDLDATFSLGKKNLSINIVKFCGLNFMEVLTSKKVTSEIKKVVQELEQSGRWIGTYRCTYTYPKKTKDHLYLVHKGFVVRSAWGFASALSSNDKIKLSKEEEHIIDGSYEKTYGKMLIALLLSDTYLNRKKQDKPYRFLLTERRLESDKLLQEYIKLYFNKVLKIKCFSDFKKVNKPVIVKPEVIKVSEPKNVTNEKLKMEFAIKA
jgi:hypothetical protein